MPDETPDTPDTPAVEVTDEMLASLITNEQVMESAEQIIDGLAPIRDFALAYKQTMIDDGFSEASAAEAAGLLHCAHLATLMPQMFPPPQPPRMSPEHPAVLARMMRLIQGDTYG